MTLDLGLHLAEAIAIVFWIGVSYSDVQWLKKEVKHLRETVDEILMRSGGFIHGR